MSSINLKHLPQAHHKSTGRLDDVLPVSSRECTGSGGDDSVCLFPFLSGSSLCPDV
uniref:Uncharacterized protein n=1 Tax=Anguilla anguilla TaxID=7936 RepID=A0A0E9PH15_ANGAN